ncbi:tyrosine integrase [Rhodococcus phage Reynauld]|uniref:Tyrosine integrase n=1 Tax=Rhodococcus phage Reynauld TaxID=3062845 RepID=A0ACD4UHH2_9CAUD|nr:tyrosine integrase [Rhodococcus phage Reynauld]
MLTTDRIDEFEHHLRLSGRSKQTAERYSRSMRAFNIWAGAVSDRALAKALARWILDGRDSGLGAGTIGCRVAVARAYLTFAGVDLGPLKDYRRPPVPSVRPHPLPGGIEDARKLIAGTDGPVRNAIALCSLAGLRINEAITIDALEVDCGAVNWSLTVKGKGDKVREVPVSAELRDIIEKMPRVGRLAPLSHSHARQSITDAARALGIRGDRPSGAVASHDLRATFATEIHKRTKDIVLVQRLLGHASVVTTQRYIGVEQSSFRSAVEF